MALLERHVISHLPESLPVHIALYHDLQNATFLRQQLLSGNSDFEYAFIDASMIFSRSHLLAAIYRAIRDYLADRLKSKNVHSEIVFALSGNNNIADSFRRFGISDSTKDLLVVKVATTSDITNQTVAAHLEQHIKATPIPFTDESLLSIADRDRIRKAYKLGPIGSDIFKKLGELDGSCNDGRQEGLRKDINMLLMSSIAIRGQ